MIAAIQELRDNAPVAFVPLVLALLLFVINGARLTWIDARTHLLPNRIILPWYVFALVLLGAALLLAGDGAGLLRTFLGGAILFSFYLLLHMVQPRGMGLGDVKLAGIMGLYLGYLSWSHLLWGTVATFLLGGLASLVFIILRRAGLKTSLAFDPYLVIGTLAALFVAG
ncbi:prepilin peptidase [Arthrobacter rhombi]|uniref:prepilin peptidase n=1 Tax=Arthrobacter rhombi TaxID=71253 RepID=UPI003FD1250D